MSVSNVSVPLRGSGHESSFNNDGSCDEPSLVSVPLRESGHESLLHVCGYLGSIKGFQSPCGEVVMKDADPETGLLYYFGFQSPCGEVVMKGGDCGGDGAVGRSSFSPLAGKWS